MSTAAPSLWAVAGFGALGVAMGLLHFTTLRWNTELFARKAAAQAAALQLLRLAVTTTGFFLAARQGAMPLLLAAAGFMVARHLVVRSLKGAS